jgi:undecaprenyl-diphosphatase
MLKEIISADQQLFLWLNNCYATWLDPVMVLVSQRFTWIPLYAWLVYLLWKTSDKAATFAWKIVALLATLALCDRVSSGFIKPFFARLRPCYEPQLQGLLRVLEDCGGQFGFISSHASNTFGVAIFFWLLWREKFPQVKWLFAWASLVSYSRIYVGKHYPADILAGAILGLVCGAICYAALHKYFLSKLPTENIA